MATFIDLYNSNEAEDLETYFNKVMEGLKLPEKALPTEYNYDEEGSNITTLYNQSLTYYLANSEIEIFKEQGSSILAAIGKEKFNFVELGPGDGDKVSFLIE